MSYTDRIRLYESVKREIAKTSKSPQEYAKRVVALANKLKI